MDDDHRKWEDQLARFFEDHLDGKEPRLLSPPYVELGKHVSECQHCQAAYATVSHSWITNPNWSPEEEVREAIEAEFRHFGITLDRSPEQVDLEKESEVS